MIGYASSADEHHSCDEIIITVFHSDYFPQATSSCESEVYSVNRSFTQVRKLKGDDDVFPLSHHTLIKIAQLLSSEEIKYSCACRIIWHSSDMCHIQKIKSEFMEDVWLPVPLYVDRCQSKCINVTSVFFSETPKPLMASMVCDVFNYIIASTKLGISHSFFNCMNSIYCSVDVIELFMHMFGDVDFLSDLGLWHLKISPRSFNVQKEIVEPLSLLEFSPSSDRSSYLKIIVDAKRECISGVCKDLLKGIESKSGWKRFVSSFSNRTEVFSDTLIKLSDVFMAGENINSISDVRYLTFYELHSAFAFYDTRLSLKTIVARNRLRQRILNKLTIPLFIDTNI